MYIHVRIKTKQKENSLEQLSETKYLVCVKEEPKQNRANTKMIELLAHNFNTQKIKIVSGHHSPSKLISIDL